MDNMDYMPLSLGDVKMSDLSNTLTHHGTKGMRWGVRRYQNPDGSLTDAGRKRQTLSKRIHDYKVNKKRKKSLEKARVARVEKQKTAAEREQLLKAGKIKPKDMTEEELTKSINKMMLEKRYKDLMNETRPQAKAVSEGKGFVNKMWNDGIKPGAAEAGKQLVKSFLIDKGEKALGLKKGDIADPLKKLEQTAKEYEYKEKISRAKKNMTLDNDFYANRAKRQEEETAKQSKEKSKKQAKEQAKEKSKEQAEEHKTTESNKNTKSNKEPEVERYEATGDDVFGEGTSRSSWSNSSSKTSRSKVDDIIDADRWREEPFSSVPSVYTSRGQKYVNTFLLEDKSR